MVENLTGIIVDAALRYADDFLEGTALETAAGKGCIEVVDVGLEMLAIMEGNGVCADDRRKGVLRVWQGDGGKLEFRHN